MRKDKQDYAHHSRWYTAHHFIYYPIVTAGLVISLHQASQKGSDYSLWLMISFVFLILLALSFMLRQHYALGNQDRIARLELRLRYYCITGQRLEPKESHLELKQLLALRFAGDDELLSLVEATIANDYSADEIKKNIRHWHADHMRL